MPMNVYLGPWNIWYRFLAGLAVTTENYIDDDSAWVWIKATPWHLTQFTAALEANP